MDEQMHLWLDILEHAQCHDLLTFASHLTFQSAFYAEAHNHESNLPPEAQS